jgi:hypothetical protein
MRLWLKLKGGKTLMLRRSLNLKKNKKSYFSKNGEKRRKQELFKR